MHKFNVYITEYSLDTPTAVSTIVTVEADGFFIKSGFFVFYDVDGEEILALSGVTKVERI